MQQTYEEARQKASLRLCTLTVESYELFVQQQMAQDKDLFTEESEMEEVEHVSDSDLQAKRF